MEQLQLKFLTVRKFRLIMGKLELYGIQSVINREQFMRFTVYYLTPVFRMLNFVFHKIKVHFSHVRMFEFYEGCPSMILLDNLKSCVIKPDLYNPETNKAYLEMADYYGICINTYRVRMPKDKGKIERFVPTARELFRILKKLFPTNLIHELNKNALGWCKETYGVRETWDNRYLSFRSMLR